VGFKLRLKPVRQCFRAKRRYYSMVEAQLAIETLHWSHNTWKSPEGMKAYRCEICQAYHIGHPKEEQGGR